MGRLYHEGNLDVMRAGEDLNGASRNHKAERKLQLAGNFISKVFNYNHNHDELGRFATSGGSGSGGYSKKREVGVYAGGKKIGAVKLDSQREVDSKSVLKRLELNGDRFDGLSDDVVKRVRQEKLMKLDKESLKKVYNQREKAYRDAGKTKEDFARANDILRSVIGAGDDVFGKMETIGGNLDIEEKMSKDLMGDSKVMGFRQQTQELDKGFSRTSRWSDVPSTRGEYGSKEYTTEISRSNILLHPAVIYSADYDDVSTAAYSQEREYVLRNDKLDDVKEIERR